MKKLFKRFITSTAVLVLVVVSAGYAFFPYLSQLAIQHKLPSTMSLDAYQVERPTLDGIYIESIRFGFTHSENDYLSLNQLNIKVSWFELAISHIDVEKIELALSSTPQQEPPKKSDKTTPLSEFNLPQTTIHSANLKLDFDQLPSIELQGQAQVKNDQLELRAQLNSSQSMAGNITLQSTDWQWFQLNSEIVNFDLALVDRFHQYFNLPLNNLSGLLNAKISTLFEWHNNSANIKNFVATTTANNGHLEYAGNTISNINGKLSITKDKLWRIKDSTLTGHIDTKLLKPHVKLSMFPFALTLNSLMWTPEEINTDLSLNIEPRLTLQSRSQIFFTDEPSHHVVSVEALNIDKVWSDKLANVSIGKASGQFEFDLELDPDVSIVNMESKSIQLEGLKFEGETDVDVKLVKAMAKWKPKFTLTHTPTETVTVLAEAVQWNHPALAINSLSQLEAITRFSDSNQQFSIKINPLEVDGASHNLDIEGSINGILMSSGELDATLELTSTMRKLKDSLRQIFPKRKMLKDLVANQGQPVTFQAQLNSRLNLFSAQPLNTLKINGVTNTKIDQLQVGKNRFVDLTMQIIWQPDSPWHKFSASANTKLNYLNIDQQSHKVKFDLDLIPRLQISTVDYQANLLGGSIAASTPNEFLSVDNLNGQVLLDAIDLNRISKIMDNPQLSMQGNLSGKVPFAFKDNVLIFEDGQLISTNGRVEYLPEGKKLELTQDNVSQIANITLQNFHYQLMDVQLLSGSPCEFDFKIRLEGKNPDLGGQQSQAFNINYNPISNVNLYYLLLLGKDNIKNINPEALHSGCVHDS